MKTNHFIKSVTLLLICCAMLGCGKEESKTTTIYGTVFNSVTHEPIIGAKINVGFRQTNYDGHTTAIDQDFIISSSVSGSDGQFELQFGEVNNYDENYTQHFYIKATASGYYNYTQTTGITIGSNYRMDINLDPY